MLCGSSPYLESGRHLLPSAFLIFYGMLCFLTIIQYISSILFNLLLFSHYFLLVKMTAKQVKFLLLSPNFVNGTCFFPFYPAKRIYFVRNLWLNNHTQFSASGGLSAGQNFEEEIK